MHGHVLYDQNDMRNENTKLPPDLRALANDKAGLVDFPTPPFQNVDGQRIGAPPGQTRTFYDIPLGEAKGDEWQQALRDHKETHRRKRDQEEEAAGIRRLAPVSRIANAVSRVMWNNQEK